MTKKLSLEEAKPQTCADSSNPADAIRRCEGAREDPQIGDEAGYLRYVAKREESNATAPANPRAGRTRHLVPDTVEPVVGGPNS